MNFAVEKFFCCHTGKPYQKKISSNFVTFTQSVPPSVSGSRNNGRQEVSEDDDRKMFPVISPDTVHRHHGVALVTVTEAGDESGRGPAGAVVQGAHLLPAGRGEHGVGINQLHFVFVTQLCLSDIF